MRMKRVAITFALLVLGAFVAFQETVPAQIAGLQPSDFTYLGAFRLDNTAGGLSYGTGVIGFNPLGNGGAGSLFVTGHVYYAKVAEYAIPTPVISKTLSALPVARVLRP